MSSFVDPATTNRADAWADILRDRRGSPRFPFVQELVFQRKDLPAAIHPVSGKTINMSSRGILFETSSHLFSGEVLQMAINWPARLDQHCPLKIVVLGRVVRCSAGQAAVEILQHAFRTVGKGGLSL